MPVHECSLRFSTFVMSSRTALLGGRVAFLNGFLTWERILHLSRNTRSSIRITRCCIWVTLTSLGAPRESIVHLYGGTPLQVGVTGWLLADWGTIHGRTLKPCSQRGPKTK